LNQIPNCHFTLWWSPTINGGNVYVGFQVLYPSSIAESDVITYSSKGQKYISKRTCAVRKIT